MVFMTKACRNLYVRTFLDLVGYMDYVWYQAPSWQRLLHAYDALL